MNEERIRNMVKGIILKNYRVATCTWAGGNNTVEVKTDLVPSATGTSQRTWSKNGRWSGNNAEFSVTVSENWLAIPPSLQAADGMLTTHAVPVEGMPGVWEASWVVQSRGFGLNTTYGFIQEIMGDGDGGGVEHIHARTLRGLGIIRAKREYWIKKVRADAHAQRVASGAQALIEEHGDVVVHIADSRAAGNCDTGTADFAARNFPNRAQDEGATVREVLNASASAYSIRACREAIAAKV